MGKERQGRGPMRATQAPDYPDRRQLPQSVIPGHKTITRAKEQTSE